MRRASWPKSKVGTEELKDWFRYSLPQFLIRGLCPTKGKYAVSAAAKFKFYRSFSHNTAPSLKLLQDLYACRHILPNRRLITHPGVVYLAHYQLMLASDLQKLGIAEKHFPNGQVTATGYRVYMAKRNSKAYFREDLVMSQTVTYLEVPFPALTSAKLEALQATWSRKPGINKEAALRQLAGIFAAVVSTPRTEAAIGHLNARLAPYIGALPPLVAWHAYGRGVHRVLELRFPNSLLFRHLDQLVRMSDAVLKLQDAALAENQYERKL